MVSTKWTYHKERSFASNHFIFWKFCFSLRTPYKELIWYTNNPNVHICTFCKRWSFIWRCVFPVSKLNKRFHIQLQFTLSNKKYIFPYKQRNSSNVHCWVIPTRHCLLQTLFGTFRKHRILEECFWLLSTYWFLLK